MSVITTLTLEGIQIKSLEKAQLLANALDIIEVECGIHSCRIKLKNVFVCPHIDISLLNATPMEGVLKDILEQIKEQS